MVSVRFDLIESESPRSPLCHFTSVIGIDINNGTFRQPSNYTSLLAGMLWVSGLLMLEYALPKHEYSTLQGPSRAAYADHGWRLEEIWRAHLIEGSYSPTSHS